MGTLLEAIGIVLKTYFGFGFPNAYAIGDSLRPVYTEQLQPSPYFKFLFICYNKKYGFKLRPNSNPPAKQVG